MADQQIRTPDEWRSALNDAAACLKLARKIVYSSAPSDDYAVDEEGLVPALAIVIALRLPAVKVAADGGEP